MSKGKLKWRSPPNSDVVAFGGIDRGVPIYRPIPDIVEGSDIEFSYGSLELTKCCFHSLILSCWFAAFSFALAVLFLPLTS